MNIIKIVTKQAKKEGFTPFVSSMVAGVLIGFSLLGMAYPQVTKADYDDTTCATYVAKLANEAATKAVKTMKVVITAYSSTPDQTDDTPFITASGKKVADGIVANNLLPFGTKIRIPELFGNKVFIVQDRMAKRKGNNHVDIWFPSKQMALNFGAKTAHIEVLD